MCPFWASTCGGQIANCEIRVSDVFGFLKYKTMRLCAHFVVNRISTVGLVEGLTGLLVVATLIETRPLPKG